MRHVAGFERAPDVVEFVHADLLSICVPSRLFGQAIVAQCVEFFNATIFVFVGLVSFEIARLIWVFD